MNAHGMIPHDGQGPAMQPDTPPTADPTLDDGAQVLARANRQARLLLLGLLAALLLMALLPIRGAVVAAGEVSVDSQVKIITHPTGGVLSALLVREGQRVRAGQPLVALDRGVLGTTAANATLSRDQLLALRARLAADRDDLPQVAFPPELTGTGTASARDAMVREQRQFALARRERQNTLALLDQRVRQYQEQINSYRAQIRATRQQLVLIQPELDGLRQLMDRGLVTINRLNQMERTAVQLTASEASLQADIAQAEAQISETQQQILNVTQSRRVQAGTELATVIAQLSDQDSRTVSIQDSLARATITAPQAGVVDQISYRTIGSAVPPNEPIVRLVPDEDRLIVTAQVSIADVDALRLGQEARIRFSTLDRELSPEVPGKLVFIAAERNENPQAGVSFYRVRVAVDRQALDGAVGQQLRSGQPVELFFTTGNRSILSYLLKPFADHLRRAMRE